MNAGVFHFDESQADNTIALNIRYPQGTDPETIKSTLERDRRVATVSLSAHGHTPHYVPMDDELVSTLLRVYENKLASKGHEQVIGGGTFGRLLNDGGCLWCYVPQTMSILCTKLMSSQMSKISIVQQLFTQKPSMN